MPVEITVEMYAAKEVELPSFTGHLARAILLRMIRWLDPALSEAMHAAEVAKPYSVTPLYFKSLRRTERGYLLDPTHAVRFKIRFLQDHYGKHIVDYFTQKDAVTLQGEEAKIASLHVKAETFREIEESTPSILDLFRVIFRTPTYLASKGYGFYDLYPEPVKVFTNLLRLWHKCNPERAFDREQFLAYKAWLQRNVGITGHELTTRTVEMGEKTVTGFMGYANYRVKQAGAFNKTTAALARFAEYSNIGGNRTGGFGVVRVSRKSENKEAGQASHT